MKNFSIWALIVSLVVVSFSRSWANDEIIVKPDAARPFAVLPDGVRFPEGIAANPKTEEIYVATFDFGPNSNKLLRFQRMDNWWLNETSAKRRFWDSSSIFSMTRFTSATSALRKFSGLQQTLPTRRQ